MSSEAFPLGRPVLCVDYDGAPVLGAQEKRGVYEHPHYRYECAGCGHMLMIGTEQEFAKQMKPYMGNEAYFLTDGENLTVDGYELRWNNKKKELIPVGISSDPQYYLNGRAIILHGEGLIEVLDSEIKTSGDTDNFDPLGDEEERPHIRSGKSCNCHILESLEAEETVNDKQTAEKRIPRLSAARYIYYLLGESIECASLMVLKRMDSAGEEYYYVSPDGIENPRYYGKDVEFTDSGNPYVDNIDMDWLTKDPDGPGLEVGEIARLSATGQLIEMTVD